MRFDGVDEQHANFSVVGDVAHGEPHAVTVETGEQQGGFVQHVNKASMPAFVGHGREAVRIYCGEEKVILLADKRLRIGI